MTQFNTMCI